MTTRNGEFVVPLAKIPPPDSEYLLIVEDGQGATLAEQSFRSDSAPGGIVLAVSEARIAAAQPAVTESVAPPLLVASTLKHQVLEIQNRVKEGVLKPDALRTHRAAMRPLLWLAELYADAGPMLEGDPAAAARWRTALLRFRSQAQSPNDNQLLPDIPLSLSAGGVFNEDAFSLLVAATVWAARDGQEEERLFAGLATATSPQFLFDQVAQLLAQGRTAPLRALLMAPTVPGWDVGDDIGPDIDIPIPPVGGDDFWPEDHWIPKLLDSRVLRELGKYLPGRPEDCRETGRKAAAGMRDRTPAYRIEALSNPRACPGDILSLDGTGFTNVPGEVLFPSFGGYVNADIQKWTDTKITLIVPVDAMAGRLIVKIFVGYVPICGIERPVYRAGEHLVDFDGGVAGIWAVCVSEQVEPGPPNRVRVPPNEISVRFTTNEGSGSSWDVALWEGAKQLNRSDGRPGGMQLVIFPAPITTTILKLRVEITARAPCGPPAVVNREVVVLQRAGLRILGVEVVQAIQRFDLTGARNNVRLCAHRATVARVHLTSGLTGGFDYGAGPNLLPYVTGRLECVDSGGKVLDIATPLYPAWIHALPHGATFRGDKHHTLNFRLPANVLSGDIRLQAEVAATGPEWSYEADFVSPPVKFEARPIRNIVQVLVRDDWPTTQTPKGKVLPAPAESHFWASLNGAYVRYPVPDGGFIIHPSGPAGSTIGILHDLRTAQVNKDKYPGWKELIEDLEEMADDSDFPDNFIWAALVPSSNAYALNGRANQHPALPRCFAVRQNLPASCAHELAHCLNIGHADCGNHDPKTIDKNLSPHTEDFGFNVQTVEVVPKGRGDIMSYCELPIRWPSITLWERMFDL